MTPLIDMAFLLIVFFVLVSQVTSAEMVDLSLPHPTSGAAKQQDGSERIVVNVIPATDGGAAGYRLGKREFTADSAGLQQLVISALRNDPALLQFHDDVAAPDSG